MTTILLAVWLVFQHPATGPIPWWQVDSDTGDSTSVHDCEGSAGFAPIRQLETVELWGWPVTGGGLRKVLERSAAGMEGQWDSIEAPWPGTFYVVDRNPVGPSCASDPATVLPANLTGVEAPAEVQERIVSLDLLDVRGRRLWSLSPALWPRRSGLDMGDGVATGRRLPSGVYFLRGKTASGGIRVRKVVVAR